MIIIFYIIPYFPTIQFLDRSTFSIYEILQMRKIKKDFKKLFFGTSCIKLVFYSINRILNGKKRINTLRIKSKDRHEREKDKQ